MSFPCRLHFSIFEIIGRWGITITDVRYYLETGTLEAQVLLAKKLIQVYHRIETPEGEEAWIKKEVRDLDGYVVIQPDELRKVFRLKTAPIHKFKNINDDVYYKIIRRKDITPVSIEDLWISGKECARFEKLHKITALQDLEVYADGNKTGIVSLSPGRPSIMKRITERYRQRLTSGETLPTMTAEAKFLRSWASDVMPNIQIPSVKTIQNRLSSGAVQ